MPQLAGTAQLLHGTWNLAPVSGPAIPAGGFDSPKIATSYAKRRGWKVTRNPGLDD